MRLPDNLKKRKKERQKRHIKGFILSEKSRRYWYGSPEERVHFNERSQTVNRKGEVIIAMKQTKVGKKGKKRSARLYNMDRQEWREVFTKGDSWRSDTIHKCEICHTKINRWVMAGYPSCGPRIWCPAEDEKWHDRLESALTQCDELDHKIRDYKGILKSARKINAARAKEMINSLCIQRELLKEKIRALREKFSGKFDDVEDLGPGAKVEEFGHYVRYGEKDILED